MKTKIQSTIIALLISYFGFSQNNFWTKTTTEELRFLTKMERSSMPKKYELYSLDLIGLNEKLNQAPNENQEPSAVILDFPGPDGRFVKYRIYQAPIMEPELMAKYPTLKSYVGIGVDAPSASIRFSVTLFGLHSMSVSGFPSTYYIDTYTKDLNHYIVYSRNNIARVKNFTCLNDLAFEPTAAVRQNNVVLSSDGKLRQYRLAMACTVEYAEFHIDAANLNDGSESEKKAAVLSAMVVTMTRVNGLFERELSIRMNLVTNNDSAIFIDSDNFTNDDTNILIDESQVEIDAAIGFSNYDIGHTVCTCGGGLAQVYSPCTTSKAKGVSGLSSPVGDPFDVGYVCHEIAHQFGAGHTFNNECDGAINLDTAVEPGSGSTIMSYAGICDPVVQNDTDDYFHTVSISEMMTFILEPTNCSVATLNGNNAPIVNAGPDWTIPKGTAFVLKPQNVSDSDGDMLTYCWEQTDNEVSIQPPLEDNATGPNFRTILPLSTPERYMPRLSDVIAGNLTPTWEVVSSVGRTYNFALTVRDNRALNGGQVTRDNIVVTSSNTIGPFKVTSQNVLESWVPGQPVSISWDTNGSQNLIGSSNVDILLSIDGGLTFPISLTPVGGVTNSGFATIIAPNLASLNCRVMVKPTANIYYAVNSSPFYLGYSLESNCQNFVSANVPVVIPETISSIVSTITVTSGAVLNDVNISLNITHPLINDLVAKLKSPSGTEVTLFSNRCYTGDYVENIEATFDDSGIPIICDNLPGISGTVLPEQSLAAFIGENSTGVWTLTVIDVYEFEGGSLDSWSLDICTPNPLLTSSDFKMNNFSIHPNPSNGLFEVINMALVNYDISITDVTGKVIYSENGIHQKNKQFEINNINTGVYFVIIDSENLRVTKKIVIK